MTSVTIIYSILFWPFLLSLAGKATEPKLLCLFLSAMALLSGADPYRAALPWAIGMAIAVLTLHERFREI
jgi:hypothetical protein